MSSPAGLSTAEFTCWTRLCSISITPHLELAQCKVVFGVEGFLSPSHVLLKEFSLFLYLLWGQKTQGKLSSHAGLSSAPFPPLFIWNLPSAR